MASLFVGLLGIYSALGLLFGLWFVFAGAGRLDKGAQSSKWYVRLLWLPGAIALWVVLLPKFLRDR